ncbi:hypothetical protein VM1G_05160 [Cytospora mali]|uniref:Uncharacterized protein n=1 Tax=Cytospora mali TaxID=578113 RepID=A0A194VZI3_CYTMA|nr:hypothetical protein VM1G_05160 [Valsa mali]
MPNLSGSKRRAETAFASPTKAAASTKRARTYYDYYDEEDVESSPEEQWSDEDTESESRMSLDDDEWLALENFSLTHRKDAPITEIYVRPPPAPTTRCRCLATGTKDKACADSCDCSKWGHGCKTTTCGCQGGPSCNNPFNKLDVQAIFGAGRTVLHPCFISWMLRQETVQPERITTRYLFDMVVEDAAFIEARYGRCKSQPYRDWRDRWDRLPASERSGDSDSSSDGAAALRRELVRMALTVDGLGRGTFYSFCCPGCWGYLALWDLWGLHGREGVALREV